MMMKFTFVDTCGGSDGAEVAVTDDLKSSKVRIIRRLDGVTAVTSVD